MFEVLNNHPDAETRYKEAGLSPCRFRWDCFHATKIRIGDGIGLTGDITVPDCHDSHIDTALRRIMKEYGNEWGATH